MQLYRACIRDLMDEKRREWICCRTGIGEIIAVLAQILDLTGVRCGNR